MGLPERDDPPAIYDEESKQELFGRGPSKVGLELYEVIAIVLAIVGAAVGFDKIGNGSQWILLAAILVLLFGLIIALNPGRREP
jgi:hypothetical protein